MTVHANLDRARQLGTALEWPEAKKNADKVRRWGIEVCAHIAPASVQELIDRLSAITRDMESSQGKRTRCASMGR